MGTAKLVGSGVSTPGPPKIFIAQQTLVLIFDTDGPVSASGTPFYLRTSWRRHIVHQTTL